MRKQKPPKCCHPDCFNCPYKDCRYGRMEASDYTETNNRDYFLYYDSTGRKLHKPADKAYLYARKAAYDRENRKDYLKQYYQDHRDEILQRRKENYDPAENAVKCREYRQKHLKQRKRYDKNYYQANKERIKARVLARYYEKVEEQKNECINK